MKILAINTASSQTGIALIEYKNGTAALIGENNWQAKNDEAEKLLPAIENLVGKFDKIEAVIVVRGPGSFTGLRVGITVANTISYLTGAKLHALSTFEYWHIQSDLPCVVYAGSKGIYLEEELFPLDQIYQVLKEKNIKKVTGDISHEQINELKDIEFFTAKMTFGESMIKFCESGKFQKSATLKIVEPLYIKEPGITQSKK